MIEIQKFKSNYFLRFIKGDIHPFTPNLLYIDSTKIEYRRRNWFLLFVDTETLHFQNITGVSVNKHLFGASIKIKSTGIEPIIIWGYWNKNANQIKTLCSKYIQQRGQTASSNQISIADELLKFNKLLRDGIITQEEFDKQKEKLIN